jgi:hypothetical protein
MDYSHVMKKLRNNIYSSGHKGTRLLLLPSVKDIRWQYWIKAFEWDQTNPIQIHKKLKRDHVYLNSESKMKNHLAEEVLDTDMLQLIMEYKISEGVNGCHLDGVIQLLESTSAIIKVFRDRRPLNSMSDHRLKELKQAHLWFLTWESAVLGDNNNSVERNKRLISDKSRYDLASCIVGFNELCKQCLLDLPGASIVPSRLNSDVLENEFSQQRGLHNGADTNPNYATYQKTVNNIILGQATVSKNSNAFRKGADPYRFTTPNAA